MDHEIRELIGHLNTYRYNHLEIKLAKQKQKQVKKMNAAARAQLKLAAKGQAYRDDVYNAAMDELKYWEQKTNIFKHMTAHGSTSKMKVLGFVSFQRNKNNRQSFTIKNILDIDPMLNHSTVNFLLKEMVAHGGLDYKAPPDGISGRGICGIYSFSKPKHQF